MAACKRPVSFFPSAVSYLVVGLSMLLWLVGTWHSAREGRHFTSDSVAYIQCARHILSGHGFQIVPVAWNAVHDSEPIRLWPPGYSTAIALLSYFGLPDWDAAVLVNWLAFTISLAIVAWVFISWFPITLAGPLVISAGALTKVWATSTMAWTEGGFTLFTVLAFLFLARTADNRWQSLGAVLSGTFAGLAFCFRNAGLAFFPSALLTCLSRRPFSQGIRLSLWFCVGALAGCGWLIGWNIATFGKLLPYEMPPSDLGLLDNIRHSVRALIGLFIPGWYKVRFIFGLVLVIWLVVVWLAVEVLAKRGTRFLLPQSPNSTAVISRDAAKFLGFFLPLYVLQIVVARTRYFWGEIINFRHFVPIAWLVLIAVGLLATEIFRSRFSEKGKVFLAGLILTGVYGFLVQHVAFAVREVIRPIKPVERILIDAARQMDGLLPSGRLLGDGTARIYLSIFAKREVRYAPRITRRELTLDEAGLLWAARNGWFTAVVMTDLHQEEISQGVYGEGFADLQRLTESNNRWVVISVGPFKAFIPKPDN